MDMVRHGNENMVIADRLHRWARNLFQVRSARALPATLAARSAASSWCRRSAIKVWDVAGRYAEEAFAQGVSEDVRSFASSLTQPYCGVNSGFEAVNWLDDPAMAMSIALIPLARRRRQRHRAGFRHAGAGLAGPSALPEPAWARTSWSASPNWRAPRCRGCARAERWTTRLWSSATSSMCGSKNGWRRARWNSMRSTCKNSPRTPPRRAWNSRGCRTRTCAAGWRRCTAAAAAAAASRSSCRAGAASTCGWAGRAWWTAIRCRTCARPRRPSRCPRP